jgi:GSH-dependent disulfide-bond oxidoreductase
MAILGTCRRRSLVDQPIPLNGRERLYRGRAEVVVWGKRLAARQSWAPIQTERSLMIDLYFWPTGNGKKVVILLEECGLPYTIKPVNIGRGDQFTADFLKIAPNNRMPAIVDNAPLGGGKPLSIFESGAIMMYIAEKAGKFWPQAPHEKYDVAQWVMWQTGNQGAKLGEQGHFRRAAMDPKNGDLSYAVRRFDNEAHRLFGVMNLGLFDRQYLAAGEYTIADMICYPWSASWQMRGLDIEEFPNVKRWLDDMAARPAVQKAMAMGPEFREDPATITPEEQERRRGIMANQRAQPIPPEWQSAA